MSVPRARRASPLRRPWPTRYGSHPAGLDSAALGSAALAARGAALGAVFVLATVPALIVPVPGTVLAAGIADAAALLGLLAPGAATGTFALTAAGAAIGFAVPHHSGWLPLEVAAGAGGLWAVHVLLALAAAVPRRAVAAHGLWRRVLRSALPDCLAAAVLAGLVALLVTNVAPGRDLALRATGFLALALLFVLPALALGRRLTHRR